MSGAQHTLAERVEPKVGGQRLRLSATTAVAASFSLLIPPITERHVSTSAPSPADARHVSRQHLPSSSQGTTRVLPLQKSEFFFPIFLLSPAFLSNQRSTRVPNQRSTRVPSSLFPKQRPRARHVAKLCLPPIRC